MTRLLKLLLEPLTRSRSTVNWWFWRAPAIALLVLGGCYLGNGLVPWLGQAGAAWDWRFVSGGLFLLSWGLGHDVVRLPEGETVNAVLSKRRRLQRSLLNRQDVAVERRQRPALRLAAWGLWLLGGGVGASPGIWIQRVADDVALVVACLVGSALLLALAFSVDARARGELSPWVRAWQWLTAGRRRRAAARARRQARG